MTFGNYLQKTNERADPWCVQILAKKEKETFSQPTDVAR
jgi:hypothetical protein